MKYEVFINPQREIDVAFIEADSKEQAAKQYVELIKDNLTVTDVVVNPLD